MSLLNGRGQARRYDLSELDFVVPEHVRDRFEERLGVRPTHEEIRQDAFDAIYRGRFSRELPDWLRGGAREAREAFYAWPEDRRYAYVVTWGSPRPRNVHLFTVVVPQPLNPGLREALKHWLRANRGEE